MAYNYERHREAVFDELDRQYDAAENVLILAAANQNDSVADLSRSVFARMDSNFLKEVLEENDFRDTREKLVWMMEYITDEGFDHCNFFLGMDFDYPIKYMNDNIINSVLENGGAP